MDDERSPASSGAVVEATVSLDEIPLHSTTLLTALDAEGVIRYESPAIERIFGFEPAELVGEPVAEYFHPDDRDAVMAAFQDAVENDEYHIESAEYRHETADGSYRWVESVTSSKPTPDGYYIVNTRDVSDRRAREEVLERTNERLDAFASVVSHDLRNPLNVATGRLELAMEECDSEHLEPIETAHDRMIELIGDLLTLARAGSTADARESVWLADLLEECWETVETDDATLVPAVDGAVNADPSRLQQLLENLFRNAVVHGGEDVTVTVGELEDGSGFYVADDGPGIPADERERVLEWGYTTADDGTGLGLAIVKEVADAHGWRLSLSASDAGGTRVELTGVEFE